MIIAPESTLPQVVKTKRGLDKCRFEKKDFLLEKSYRVLCTQVVGTSKTQSLTLQPS